MSRDAAAERRLVAVVHGSVQGVGFRWFVRREAAGLGIDGWVSNQADGTVEVVAQADVGSLKSLLERLHDGPAGASVADIDVRYEPARGHMSGFDIRSGAHRGD